MVDHPRARKLAERIQVIVAQMLDTRIKDPRLGFVTVTDVRVTGDLQNASVFYTVMGDEEARAGTAAALESAKGMIRSEVGKLACPGVVDHDGSFRPAACPALRLHCWGDEDAGPATAPRGCGGRTGRVRPYERGFSRISKVSMTSSTRRSLKDPRPIPHS